MTYESEIINELLEQRGHELSSLHYQSECIETWIDEMKGAYPKLCDYQSEWLNYIHENSIGEFPYETITTNSTATVNNVVPLAYKSAILKGNTLVNIVNYSETFVSTSGKYLQISSLVYSPIGKPITLINFSDKVITFQVTANGTFKKSVIINANSKTVITLSDGEEIKNIRGSQSNGWEINETSLNELKLGLMVIDGDYTNVDIPYFTGMQSVKMPVLTTSNEDGTETNILTVNEDVELRGIGEVQDTLDCLTGEVTERICEIVLDGSEAWIKNGSTTGYTMFRYIVPNLPTNSSIRVGCMLCDKFIVENYISLNAQTREFITIRNGTTGQLLLNVSNEKANEVAMLKEWLSQNPLTVQYQLATESIKTVELMITNQDVETMSKIKPIEGTMNIEITGTPIVPTAILEIPVEAITQNLNSFIEEE